MVGEGSRPQTRGKVGKKPGPPMPPRRMRDHDAPGDDPCSPDCEACAKERAYIEARLDDYEWPEER